jgi:flagellar basal-body rod protein FlgF
LNWPGWYHSCAFAGKEVSGYVHEEAGMKEIYQVLAGAMGRERALDQIANNLANVNTTGFKKDGSAFVDTFRQAMAATAGSTAASTPGASVNGSATVWPTLGSAYTDFSAGSFQNTEQPLDIALDGEGFLSVEGAGQTGPLYTRAGNLTLNADKELVTADGRRVLSEGGSPITFVGEGEKISITQQGEIFEGATSLGKLGVIEFEQPGQLQKFGDSLFSAPQGVPPQAATQTVVRQGLIEGSNVNPISELVAMIRTERAYQADQKVMQTIDEITSKRLDAAMGR